MANYVVAVSGGVDSVCLLHMLSTTPHNVVVAHVDHGIRGEASGADARFVAGLAELYHLPFVTTSLQLGPDASEEKAREARYAFLFTVATQHNATVATAHHQNDVVETIAINLTRGTGWRGLAVLDRLQIYRPLLQLTKQQLLSYATAHRLEWVEDATNESNSYLRNRIRKRTSRLVAESVADTIMVLRAKQLQLKKDIAQEVARIQKQYEGSRHLYTQIDGHVAIELLCSEIEIAGGVRPTRPQASRSVHAIKTAAPGSVFQMGNGVELHFTTRKFTVHIV
ncbi:tRNA lysidine(34) synthetase TilS [Candidatus Saccharibacteria bacterium]|nr:tRNA lysidine(34) synthetase TilS [Candidatus Saccharibacteria bacterium]